MYEFIEQSTYIFDSILMPIFFWYSLGLVALKLADAIKPKFFRIDQKICKVISILGIVYIFATLIVCYAYHEAIMMVSGMEPNSGRVPLHFWFLILWRPLLLFMFTQLLRVEQMSNSMVFRGITAVLFLIIR
ncbi:hypothetical protein [uncultured Kordia sp.]|uniref:hypothetical protein n=1 Tax=uncultured Kordia sp. TaxID=507699 RepID=UPI002601E5F8|nr:hypothetical protein [uncultured Kordia sp.]